MRLEWSKIEKDIQEHRSEIIEKLIGFVVNDVLLFWSADEDLRQEQEKHWTPILKWVRELTDINFEATDGLDIVSKNKDRAVQLKKIFEQMSIKELTSFYMAAVNMRSVLLALALVKGKIDAQKAFELSELEELYQMQKWGDEPVASARRQSLAECLQDIEKYRWL